MHVFGWRKCLEGTNANTWRTCKLHTKSLESNQCHQNCFFPFIVLCFFVCLCIKFFFTTEITTEKWGCNKITQLFKMWIVSRWQQWPSMKISTLSRKWRLWLADKNVDFNFIFTVTDVLNTVERYKSSQWYKVNFSRWSVKSLKTF